MFIASKSSQRHLCETLASIKKEKSMIKFFRKIRQKLLSENKFSKYLIYAIGEIVLVVIGILLALQINNWNQNRINRRTEIKYLKTLQKDLQQDTSRINRLIFKRFDKKMEGLQLAKSYAIGNYLVQDTAQFLAKVSYGAVYANGIDFLRTNTYDELITTGNLQLIRNDSLKTSITNYYNFVRNQKTNVNYYISGYINLINSLKPFDDNNPDFISSDDKLYMMKHLKSDLTIQKVNLEITYGKAVKNLVTGVDRFAKIIIILIQQEINKELKDGL